MRKIVTIQFGSHLYGTSTPASDLDIKSVYVPNARSIALQGSRAPYRTSGRKTSARRTMPAKSTKSRTACNASSI